MTSTCARPRPASTLAAAVAREGGIGVIAANAIGMLEDDYYDDPAAANVRALRREVRKARLKSDGLIGVNIMVAVDCFHRLLDAAIEEKVDFLFFGAGLPIKGIPVRAIRSPFLAAIARGEKKLFRCPSRCLESCEAGKARYCISEALDSARKGDFENGFVFCGANAHRVQAIVPVRELVGGLKKGYALACFAGSVRAEYEKAAEKLRVLKEEYAVTLAGVRAKVQDDMRRLAEEKDAWIRVEKARLRGRLKQIVAEYAEARSRLNELEAELGFFLSRATSLSTA